MLRFLINLFNLGKKRIRLYGAEEKYQDGDMEIIVDKEQGTMTVKTSRRLSENEIIELFTKYVIGDR